MNEQTSEFLINTTKVFKEHAARNHQLAEYLEQSRGYVNQLLDKFLPSVDTEPKTLHAAMRYSVMAGGKRLRPTLALAAFEYSQTDSNSDKKSIEMAAAALPTAADGPPEQVVAAAGLGLGQR